MSRDFHQHKAHPLPKIQLKTVAKTAGTPAWDIHRSILRPLACNCEELGFDYPTAVGVEGGVVLIECEMDANQKITDSYSYTDVYVINAIALKFIDRHGNTVNAAKNLRETIRKGEPHETLRDSCSSEPRHMTKTRW